MNNFINHRIQAIPFSRTLKSYKHNLRIEDSKHQQNNNYNIMRVLNDEGQFEEFDFNYISNKDLDNFNDNQKLDYIEKRKNILNLFHTMKDNISADREDHKAKYKKTYKQNLTTDSGTYAEGVLTFSPQMQSDYENGLITKEEVLDLGLAAAKETCETLGTKLDYITLHLDETTLHMHYGFKNYNDKGLSITHNSNIKKRLIELGIKTDIDTKDTLTYLQDIAYKHFSTIGINRGIKKEFTNSKYKKASDWHDEQLQNKKTELHQLKTELKDLQQNVKEIKQEYKNASGADFTTFEDYNLWCSNQKILLTDTYTKINEQKSMISEIEKQHKNKLDENVRNAKQEVVNCKEDIEKIKTNNIDLYKLNEELLSESIKLEKDVKKAKFIIEKATMFENNEAKSENSFADMIVDLKNKHTKFTIFNAETFKADLIEEFNNLARIKAIAANKENEILLLKHQNTNLIKDYNSLEKRSENVLELENKIKSLESENETLKETKTVLLSNIDTLNTDNITLKVKADKYDLYTTRTTRHTSHGTITTTENALDRD